MLYKKKKFCGICDSSNLVKLFDLKKFPITGIYIKKKLRKNFNYFFNQHLNICKKCGHIQLGNFVNPEFLYNNFYSTRTSDNHLSKNGIEFFKNFLFDVTKKKTFRNFAEIGCNDIKLIKSLKSNFKHLYGIDPIWRSKKNIKDKKITVIGGFIEKINLKKTIKEQVEIFSSTHNLEHLSDPYEALKKIVDYSDKDTLFFIEVPDVDLMIKNLRFDQIFHQHYHYFNFNSLNNLINKLNCKIIKKRINPNFWGGSILIAFKKDSKLQRKKIFKNIFHLQNKKILENYSIFKKHYKKLRNNLIEEKSLVGYGAGQMVPSFAYHLKSNLAFLDYIVDDNKNRQDQSYPNLKPKIRLSKDALISKKKVLITALDGVKAISNKLKRKKIDFVNPLFR